MTGELTGADLLDAGVAAAAGAAGPACRAAVEAGPRVGVAGGRGVRPWRFWLAGEPTARSTVRGCGGGGQAAGDGATPRLTGRVGVVTGAGRGLGREIARGLAAEGMALLALSRTGSEVARSPTRSARRTATPVLAAWAST